MKILTLPIVYNWLLIFTKCGPQRGPQKNLLPRYRKNKKKEKPEKKKKTGPRVKQTRRGLNEGGSVSFHNHKLGGGERVMNQYKMLGPYWTS